MAQPASHPPVEARSPTPGGLVVEAVLCGPATGKVAYWRYRRPGEAQHVGAVSRHPVYQERDRALGYPLDRSEQAGDQNTELGTFATKRRAEVAMEMWAKEGPLGG
jgi:hypothetical protein